MNRREMVNVCIITTLVFGLLSCFSVMADDASPDLELIEAGQFGGNCGAIAISGDYVYLGVGRHMHVYDVRDPGAPVLVGRSDSPAPYTIISIEVDGSRAYASSDNGKRGWEESFAALCCYDLVEPTCPRLVSQVDMPRGCEQLTVADGLVYIARMGYGLEIYDFADIGSPVRVGKLDRGSFTWLNALDVSVSGGYAFLAAESDGLVVCDVSDPSQPRVVTSLGSTDKFLEAVVHDGTAYVKSFWFDWPRSYDSEYYVRVVDVSNPLLPREAATYHDSESYYASVVALEGDTAYVSCSRFVGSRSEGSIVCLDVSDPHNPEEFGSTYSGFGGVGQAVVGSGALFGSAPRTGLVSVNLLSADPDDAVQVLHSGPHYTGDCVVVDSKVVYSADHFEGILYATDITNAQMPAALSFYDTGWWPINALAVVEGRAYALHPRQLSVVNVEDPGHMARAGWAPLPLTVSGQAQSIVVSDTVAYVSFKDRTSSSIAVLDVGRLDSNPMVPLAVYEVPEGGQIRRIVLEGDRLYLDTSEGVRLLDVSEPLGPTSIGYFDGWVDYFGYEYEDIAVHNQVLFVPGFDLLDWSEPNSPTFLDVPSMPRGEFISVSWPWAYIGTNVLNYYNPYDELDVVDLRSLVDTGRLVQANRELLNEVIGVVAQGSRAFVIRNGSGISIMDVCNGCQPVHLPMVIR